MNRLCIGFISFLLIANVPLMPAQTALDVNTSRSTSVTRLGPYILTGINNSGVVAGYSEADGRSFTWSNGVFTYFQVPGANFTRALGIDDAGKVFGMYGPNNFPFPGFVYDGHNFTTVQYPGALETSVTGELQNEMLLGFFNNSPTIDGFRFDGTNYQAFLIPGKKVVTTTTGNANNNGDFVGSAAISDSEGSEGYVFSPGKVTTLRFPGALFTGAYGINDQGIVTGGHADSSRVACFYWTAGQFVSFTVPGAGLISCNGINNAGVIVGWYQDFVGGIHGFMTSPITEADFQ